MGNSRKKIVKKRSKLASSSAEISYSSSRQQILQCLQNKCNVEVENINYLLQGKKSISLSGLPDWYYSDECFDFDQISNTVNLDEKTNEYSIETEKQKVILNGLDQSDSIQIMDTFSLASQTQMNVKSERSESLHNIPFPNRKYPNEEQTNNPKSFSKSTMDLFSNSVQATSGNNNNNVLFEDMTSVFHSSALDDLLAIEAKKLDKIPSGILQKKSNSSMNVTYNTPSCQSSYVKTLQTALIEREKLGYKRENTVGDPQSLKTSFNVISTCDSFSAANHLSSSSNCLSDVSHPKSFQRCQKNNGQKQFTTSMLQHLTKNLTRFALSALQNKSKKMNYSTDLQSKRNTAYAIKKRFSKAVNSKKKAVQENCYGVREQLSKTSNLSSLSLKEKLMEKTKFSKHSKPKSKTRFLQKITFSLASEACTALKLHWLAHCAKKGIKSSKVLHSNLTSLNPISLSQAVGKYLIYQARKWRNEKLCRDYKTFCFSKLPIQLKKVKMLSPYLELKICRHKLSWREVESNEGIMIFPEAYSVPDNTTMHVKKESGKELASLTCARTRQISSLYFSRRNQKMENLKKYCFQSPTKVSEEETDTMLNLLGNVMVIQLSHTQKKSSSMIVKIMSFCDWNSKAEEIMTIIIENHFELQSMQRGRYIRTIKDGFLIEVLRDSSGQVTHKNMPLDVQDQLTGVSNPNISLVKISAKMDLINVDSDQLIDFTEAIENMLKLDKELAKPKVNAALKMKKNEVANGSENKITPAKSLKLDMDSGFEVSVEDSDKVTFDSKKINLNTLLKKIIKHRSTDQQKPDKDKEEKAKLMCDVGSIGCLRNVSNVPLVNQDFSTIKRSMMSQPIQTSDFNSNKLIKSNLVYVNGGSNNRIKNSNDNPSPNVTNKVPVFSPNQIITKNSDLSKAQISTDCDVIKKGFCSTQVIVASSEESKLCDYPAIQPKPAVATQMPKKLANCDAIKTQRDVSNDESLRTYLAIPVKVIPVEKKSKGLFQIHQSARIISRDEVVSKVIKNQSELQKTLSPNRNLKTFNSPVTESPKKKYCYAVNLSSGNTPSTPVVLHANQGITMALPLVNSVPPNKNASIISTPKKVIPLINSPIPTDKSKVLPILKKLKTSQSGRLITVSKILKKKSDVVQRSGTAVTSHMVVGLTQRVVAPDRDSCKELNENLKQSETAFKTDVESSSNTTSIAVVSSSVTSTAEVKNPVVKSTPLAPISRVLDFTTPDNQRLKDTPNLVAKILKVKPEPSKSFKEVNENDILMCICADNEILKLCNKRHLNAEQVYSKVKAIFKSETRQKLSGLSKGKQLYHMKNDLVKSILKRNRAADTVSAKKLKLSSQANSSGLNSVKSVKSPVADLKGQQADSSESVSLNPSDLVNAKAAKNPSCGNRLNDEKFERDLLKSRDSFSEPNSIKSDSLQEALKKFADSNQEDDLTQSSVESRVPPVIKPVVDEIERGTFSDCDKSLVKSSSSSSSLKNVQSPVDDIDVCSVKEENQNWGRSPFVKKLKKALNHRADGYISYSDYDQRKIIAEKQRRHTLKQGIRKLHSLLSFNESSISKTAILIQATSEIKFLKMESENLSLVRDILMEINYKLQFQMEILQSENYASAEKLDDLKELRLQIKKEKERLTDIQNQHQTKTMLMFRLKEADAHKVSLLDGRAFQTFPPFTCS